MPGFEWFGEEERREVQEVLDTGVLFRYGFDQARKGRWKARSFEQELADRLGGRYAHLCSSGTSALSIALAACGIGAGDEVIVPPFTFVATVEALFAAGAVPVFADIDDTLCLNPAAVLAAITPRTKAVIPVHMCGAMADIDALKSICDENKLILIEDACQSLGASCNGKFAGTFGHAGCFSFDSVKTVTCGEGGAVVTDDPRIYEKLHAVADHGHDHIGNDRGLENHPMMGMNFRISELNAAVGLAQIRKLDRMLEAQRTHKQALKDALSCFSCVTFRRIPDSAGDTATFLSFFMKNEEQARQVARDLAAAGLDGCFFWYDNNWHYLRRWDHIRHLRAAAKLPIHLMSGPDYTTLSLPASDRIMSRTLSLQIKLSWRPDEIAKRIDILDKVIQCADK